jgi:hypothetical protein
MRSLILVLVLLVGLISGAVGQASQGTLRQPVLVPPEIRPGASAIKLARITADLDNLTVREAARKLATILGGYFSARDPAMMAHLASSHPDWFRYCTAPALDYTRRARLSWRDVPLGTALRQLCRAYDCNLHQDHLGTYWVLPGPFATGPEVRAGGYSIELRHVGFLDARSSGDSPEDVTGLRRLDLQFVIRSEMGDPAAIYGLENVRVVDQDRRDVLEPVERPGVLGLCNPSPFPDERLQSVSFDWPYPNPQRLWTIEADLVLYRHAHLTRIEMPIPEQSHTLVTRNVDGVAAELFLRHLHISEASLTVRFLPPPGVWLQYAGTAPQARLVLKDGTRQRFWVGSTSCAPTDIWKPDTSNDCPSVVVRLLKSEPAKIILDLVQVSEPDRRLHFRFTDYPMVLGSASRVKSHSTVPPPKAVKPPTQRRIYGKRAR